MVILTILLTGGAFYSGMTYFLLEQESQETKNIVIDSKIGGEEPKIKRYLYIPNRNFSSLERIEVEANVEADRDRLVIQIYDDYFKNLRDRKGDFSQPKLLNIYWADRDLYLNLENSSSITGDQSAILVVLYGLTNSLSEMGGVNRIKFLIDGKEVGGVFSSYYERNLKI